MSILKAIQQVSGQSRSLDELARLPQNVIMQMVQNKEIDEDQLAPILNRKAEIADDIAKARALEAGKDQPQPTVMDTLLAKNAMAEHPMPQQMPQQMATQMPQAPEEAGVGQLPIPTRTYAGGGIIAFADGGDIDPEEDDDSTIIQKAMAKRATKAIDGLMSSVKNVPAQLHELYTQLPKSFEAAKAELSKQPSGDSFLSKIEHLESRGNDYDKYGNLLTSSKGAKGRMQVMDKTNLNPGFGVKPAQDNSPEERARVGRDYALALKNHFGDEKIAAMAYNWGPGNVKNWLESKGKIPVPHETRQYAANFASGGYIPSYSGDDGVSYVDLYGNKVNVPMGYDDEEEALPKTKTEPKYKETPRKTIEEVLNPNKPAGPQNPFKGQPASTGINTLLPRRGGDEYSNVYPVGGAGADASYLNQLMMESKKDPSYQPYKDEINSLLKKSPNLLNVVEAQNKATAQPANTTVVNKQQPAGNQPTVDKNAMVDQYLNEYLSNQKAQGKPVSKEQKSEEESYIKRMIARDEEERKRIHASSQEDKTLALLAAGLGMMGGTSPYAMANIGQGGLQGVQALAASKARRANELTALSKTEANTAWQQEQMKTRADKLAMDKANQLRDDYRIRENDIRTMVTKMVSANPTFSVLPPDKQQAMLDKQIQDALSRDQYYQSLANQLDYNKELHLLHVQWTIILRQDQ
jgi:hypothetical protein